MFIAMLFNPFQIADNSIREMQLGMIAANVFCYYCDTADQIQDTGTVEAHHFHGLLFQGRPF
jgi:subfamily B ATP-binding cassette protein MsbA